MLWPHYLRTISSLSVVAFTPVLHAMKMAEVVPADFEIYSRPVGPKNTFCRYRSTRDVMLDPQGISGITMTTEPDGRSRLAMRFYCSSQADWSGADLSRLSLYLGADVPVSSQLHLMLTKREAALYMRLPGQNDRTELDGYFSPGGYVEEDGLWPKGDTAFSGDNRRANYNEPREMQQALIAKGIPEQVIYCDYAGFTSLDSVIPVKEVFGQRSVTFISQGFHNQRAAWLARKNGIEAVGINAANVFANEKRTLGVIREYVARWRAALDTNLLHRRPHFTGPQIIAGVSKIKPCAS